jgi:hypothetical protein
MPMQGLIHHRQIPSPPHVYPTLIAPTKLDMLGLNVRKVGDERVTCQFLENAGHHLDESKHTTNIELTRVFGEDKARYL